MKIPHGKKWLQSTSTSKAETTFKFYQVTVIQAVVIFRFVKYYQVINYQTCNHQLSVETECRSEEVVEFPETGITGSYKSAS